MTSPDPAPADPDRARPRPRRGALSRFLFPTLDRRFLLRLSLVAALAFVFFRYLCVPARIQGSSMEPTYRDGGFVFCWRPRFWRRPPQAGEVVMVRLAGRRFMYLKRVVAGSGETLEFRQGQLWVNGVARQEPFVQGPCDWTLSPRVVPNGRVYVIGDNRTMPFEEHAAGSVAVDHIEGGPVW